ncbi:hypothetical protein VMCG_08769 [Cytospora schulzeri]|uniref:Uncharacterized protein n=1 Tax=Cytospora schulzeri TaxID=448051 RepID=A0A423VS65_9PEZI|nr:hypothetical protein VMCG_08769 [Valsa malicola]
MASGAYPKTYPSPVGRFLSPTRVIPLRRSHAPFMTTLIMLWCLWMLYNHGKFVALRDAETWKRPAEQTPSVNLVVATMSHDNIAWTERLKENIPNLRVIRYVSDDMQAQYHPDVPRKGMEASIFHTYFRDFYDDLPDVSLLVHSDEISWHGERIFDRSTANLLSRLDLDAVLERGYANLAVNPGQQESWLAPCHGDYNKTYIATKMALRPGQQEQDVAFTENFGIPKPEFFLAAPCCSQLAVSKDTIRKVPYPQFQHHIDWLLSYGGGDPQYPGRAWDSLWQYLFLGIGFDCPRPWRAYCRMYGICFEGEDGYKDYWDLLNKRDMTLQELRAVGEGGDTSAFDETLTEYLAADDKVDREMMKAVERGADPFYRRQVGTSRQYYEP